MGKLQGGLRIYRVANNFAVLTEALAGAQSAPAAVRLTR
jgi:hypothetical protein